MGGNIDIETQALFVCPNCEITASSELGVEGLVTVDRLQPNTELEVIDLPQEVAESEEVVALACSTTDGQEGSEFIITGRGGLPPRPSDPLSSENLVNFDASSSRLDNSSRSKIPAEEENTTQLPTPAQGWYVNSEGVLILTAQTPSAAPYSSGLKTPECHGN
jgi:large exoprotein involved in heme utilization and adhesion